MRSGQESHAETLYNRIIVQMTPAGVSKLINRQAGEACLAPTAMPSYGCAAIVHCASRGGQARLAPTATPSQGCAAIVHCASRGGQARLAPTAMPSHGCAAIVHCASRGGQARLAPTATPSQGCAAILHWASRRGEACLARMVFARTFSAHSEHLHFNDGHSHIAPRCVTGERKCEICLLRF